MQGTYNVGIIGFAYHLNVWQREPPPRRGLEQGPRAIEKTRLCVY